jgi:hypothetical protein
MECMLLNTKLLFELSVYRINESAYYELFSKYKEHNASEYIPKEHSCHIENFGGQWEYNEIIGYLKFYVSRNTQVRCEYTETKAQRKVKTRKKVFVTKTDSACVRQISRTMNTAQLIEVFEDCIQDCKNNLPSKRYIDTRIFNETYKHTNWAKVIT